LFVIGSRQRFPLFRGFPEKYQGLVALDPNAKINLVVTVTLYHVVKQATGLVSLEKKTTMANKSHKLLRLTRCSTMHPCCVECI
jgi:hypothetical protein